MDTPRISIIGIGEDGAEGLGPAARAVIGTAGVLIGGKRHLAFFPDHPAQKACWPQPFSKGKALIEAYRDQKVVVLASGDPLWHGAGTAVIAWFGIGCVEVIPHPSAYSLAAARLGWAVQECGLLTVHGRPLTRLIRDFAPDRRLLILSRDETTPRQIAGLLSETGYGASEMYVMERLGGPQERLCQGVAADWSHAPGHPLNLVAVQCAPSLTPLAKAPGLEDTLFAHDGLLTKREIRCVTLSGPNPQPGRLLWDVGAGAGSVGIEWVRAGGRAIAVEQHKARLDRVIENAKRLGAPEVETVLGTAPACLAALPAPDAIFIGGGLTEPGLMQVCHSALRRGGRLVANAVTLESERILSDFFGQHGGEMSRIAVSHLTARGAFNGWSALAPVTHFRWTKP